jgi:cyclic pyranopterin phosphate synthase
MKHGGPMKLTHVDEKGKARMVDITEKKKTERKAVATGWVSMSEKTYKLIKKGQGPKGDVFTVAKIAGIQGAKRTHELIPLCHPIPLTHVDVTYTFNDRDSTIQIISTVKTRAQTGVEMEALTSVLVAALTIYDMCKAVEKDIELGPFFLLEKSGGKSGRFLRSELESINKSKGKRNP